MGKSLYMISLGEKWPVILHLIPGKVTTVMVRSFSDVWDIKLLIYEREGIAPHTLRYILFNGQILEDHHRLVHYNINRGLHLYVVIRSDCKGIEEPLTKGRKCLSSHILPSLSCGAPLFLFNSLLCVSLRLCYTLSLTSTCL